MATNSLTNLKNILNFCFSRKIKIFGIRKSQLSKNFVENFEEKKIETENEEWPIFFSLANDTISILITSLLITTLLIMTTHVTVTLLIYDITYK